MWHPSLHHRADPILCHHHPSSSRSSGEALGCGSDQQWMQPAPSGAEWANMAVLVWEVALGSKTVVKPSQEEPSPAQQNSSMVQHEQFSFRGFVHHCFPLSWIWGQGKPSVGSSHHIVLVWEKAHGAGHGKSHHHLIFVWGKRPMGSTTLLSLSWWPCRTRPRRWTTFECKAPFYLLLILLLLLCISYSTAVCLQYSVMSTHSLCLCPSLAKAGSVKERFIHRSNFLLIASHHNRLKQIRTWSYIPLD